MMIPGNPSISRRRAIELAVLAGAGLASGRVPLVQAQRMSARNEVITRPIPKSGEQLHVIGVGTNRWGVQGEEEIAPLREIIRHMVGDGAQVVDTARVYGRGRAEEVIGQITRELDVQDDVFIATKVGTPESREHAIRMLEESFQALGMNRVSAMRAHSVNGIEILLPVLREWKDAGRFRYLGVTTVNEEQYPAIERLIREDDIDILEIDYSVAERGSAERILPLAQDHGVAVMTAVPFGGRSGNVLARVGDRPVPAFAAEIGATSWAQLALKYIVANPAVTVAIPGTTNPRHILDNLGAGRGDLPDADLRRRIEQAFDELA